MNGTQRKTSDLCTRRNVLPLPDGASCHNPPPLPQGYIPANCWRPPKCLHSFVKTKKCSKQNSLTAAQLPPTGKRRLKITVSPSTPLSPSLSPPSSPLPASYLIQFSSPVDFTSVVFPLSCPQNFTCDYYLNQMVITEFFTFNLLSSSSCYLLRRGESPQSRFWVTLFIAVGSHHSVLNTRVIFKLLRAHFFSHYSSPHSR